VLAEFVTRDSFEVGPALTWIVEQAGMKASATFKTKASSQFFVSVLLDAAEVQ